MKKSLLICTLALLTTTIAFSQDTYTLKGKIVSKDGNYALIGARISFENLEEGTIADIDGHFKLSSSNPLPWVLTIDYIGYTEQELVIEDPSIFQKVQMLEDSNSLNTIVLPYTKPIAKFISGKIIDKNTQKPLADAEVVVKGLKKGTTSDAAGNFKLRTVQHFPFTLVINKHAFNQEEIEITKEEKDLEIQLIYVLRKCGNASSTVPKNPNYDKNCWERSKDKETCLENKTALTQDSLPNEVTHFDCLLPYSWHMQPKVKIKGQIKNIETKASIAEAIIYDTYSGRICKSDQDGDFEVILPVGEYTMVIKSPGYQTQYFQLTEDYFETKKMEVELQMDVITFEESVSVPQRNFFGFLKRKKQKG